VVTEVLITNPIGGGGVKRKRKRAPMAKRRRHLSAKQKAAGFGGSRSMHTRRNPRRKSRSRPHRIRTRRNPNGEAAAPRRRRRISETSIGQFVGSTLLPAGVGAVGALALDFAMPHVPLPAALNTPTFQPVVKIGGAIAIGLVAQMLVSRRFGAQVMSGALTTTLYGLAKDKLAEIQTTAAPTTTQALQAYANGRRRLGWYSPARAAGFGVYTNDDLAA
jgi:hypothetical protein